MLETLLVFVLSFTARSTDLMQEKINTISTELNNIHMNDYENYDAAKENWGNYLESIGYSSLTDPTTLPYYYIENWQAYTVEALGDQVCTTTYTAFMENNEYSVTGSGTCISRDDYFKDDILQDAESYRNVFLETLEKKTKKMKKATIDKIVWATVKEMKINTTKKPNKKFMKKNQKMKLKNGMLVISNNGKKIQVVYNSPLSAEKAACFFEIKIDKNTITSNEIVSCSK